MDGIFNINKPKGITSFDVVSKIRRLCKTKKVGHAGTLDPDASGVLPICIGKATKVIEFLMDKDKSYRVGLMLGKATDTQDASGNILYEKPVMASIEEIEEAIKSFLGEGEQIPPMYSAVKVNGKKLYELARKGIEVERKPRPVTFFKLDILSIDKNSDNVIVIFDVECSKGTYVRTLCHDIGKKLGCGGHMISLARTRSGPFLLENAYTLDSLQELNSNNRLETAIISMDKAILNMPPVYVNQNEAIKLKNGLVIPKNSLTTGFSRVYHEDGAFLAIGKNINLNDALGLKTHKWVGNNSVDL